MKMQKNRSDFTFMAIRIVIDIWVRARACVLKSTIIFFLLKMPIEIENVFIRLFSKRQKKNYENNFNQKQTNK